MRCSKCRENAVLKNDGTCACKEGYKFDSEFKCIKMEIASKVSFLPDQDEGLPPAF
jgi:hypothetical protein